jgi:UDP-N-acetylmuramoylalanine--D-glutamate ligase
MSIGSNTPHAIGHCASCGSVVSENRECMTCSIVGRAKPSRMTCFDITNDAVRESMAPLHYEHHMELVGMKHGIRFINDSKATNVNRSWYALEHVEAPIIWIMGGVDKGNDYRPLSQLIREKVRSICVMGPSPEKPLKAFHGLIKSLFVTTLMRDAVGVANEMAEEGDSVLLSPACSSFVLYDNYEDRGRDFKREVGRL